MEAAGTATVASVRAHDIPRGGGTASGFFHICALLQPPPLSRVCTLRCFATHGLCPSVCDLHPGVCVQKWIGGFLLILFGSLLDFVAFGLAPQSFLAPLAGACAPHANPASRSMVHLDVRVGEECSYTTCTTPSDPTPPPFFLSEPPRYLCTRAALSIVWNLTLAPRFHGESLTRENLVATGVICVGVTATVIFSSHRSATELFVCPSALSSRAPTLTCVSLALSSPLCCLVGVAARGRMCGCSSPKYNLSDLLDLYQKPAMYIFVLLSTLSAENVLDGNHQSVVFIK